MADLLNLFSDSKLLRNCLTRINRNGKDAGQAEGTVPAEWITSRTGKKF